MGADVIPDLVELLDQDDIQNQVELALWNLSLDSPGKYLKAAGIHPNPKIRGRVLALLSKLAKFKKKAG